MPEPNAPQRRLIEDTEGLHLVDAGAGTGKTFTLTRRYANIVEQPGVEPADVHLVTFTENAATEMTERVVRESNYGMRELRDAPIQTFHSRCHDILMEHGVDAPAHLGIDDRITDATRILEDDLIRTEEFRRFFDRFREDHPEYARYYRVLNSPSPLESLIAELAAKGIFPTASGWYRDGETHLDGDFEEFRARFEAANEPRNEGRKQSELRAKLNGYDGDDDCYLPDAPTKDELRGSGKAVPQNVARRAFEEDREDLKRFVHDVYFGYLEYALSRNYLTFGMLQLYAFVLLCEDQALRDELTFEYVMVDEFQDTSEIQFKLALLACGTDNLCVVGDWKQSIFGFQYAAVENIQQFEDRLERFVEELNADVDRVGFEDWSVERTPLTENYRSTQAILDFAEEGLIVPATGRESIDDEAIRSEITALRSNAELETSRIEAIQHEDEHEALLTKLQSIVDNEAYTIVDDGERRPPTLGDIAVLTRTKDFGRELWRVADQYDVPMAYEGGIELFRTDQAKLVLAWLRILEGDHDRGWAVVLEQTGYIRSEIEYILAHEAYPGDMLSFKRQLQRLDGVGAVAETTLERYGYDGPDADVVIQTLQTAHDQTTMTRGDLIRFLKRGIEEGTPHEVSAPAGTDAVTVQTIHKAKGLEYPIVVLANMNRDRFPTTGRGRSRIYYEDPIGLRQSKLYAEAHGHPHRYDNWRSKVLGWSLPTEYDEERRLLYVAMTRAEQHLVFTAGETPNTFLEELPVEIDPVAPDIQRGSAGRTVQTTLDASIPVPDGPVGWSAHDLMREAVFAESSEGEGTAFGQEVHDFAEAYASGVQVEPSNGDEEHVAAFIDGLEGELSVETQVVLPLEIDNERVAISGVVDLVAVTDDSVRVIDFKTDRNQRGEPEYRKQLSVYYHVLEHSYPDRSVSAAVFYTETGDTVEIEPLSVRALGDHVPRY